MKRFTILLLLTCLMLTGCGSSISAFGIEYNEVTYTYADRNTLIEMMEQEKINEGAAHGMAEAARLLGYPETHKIIVIAKDEWQTARDNYNAYADVINQLDAHMDEKYKEYPYATTIWIYLKGQGYSDPVAAGIIGNMMAEVGGNTLDIQYWLSNGTSYYGICQWSKKYYPSIWGSSLEEQLIYLSRNIDTQFNNHGDLYKKGFTYSKFLGLTDEKDAALAFSKVYERNNSSSYKARQKNATQALIYFLQ